jgi:hypothetical protein
MVPNFKILTIFFLLFIVFNKVFSQPIQVLVKIARPYSLVAKNYIQEGNNVVITMTNTSLAMRYPQIITSLEGINNNIHIELNPTYTSQGALTLGPGETKVFTLNQIQAIHGNPGINNILIKGYERKRYFNNENLPEGLYELCINLRENGYNPSYVCTTFFINSYDPPIILSPKNNTVVNQLDPQNILFNWTPVGIPGRTQYLLKLVDLNITPVNNPNDAFKNNILPFFSQEGIIINTLVYDNTKPRLLDGHLYAVEVTAYDRLNNLLYKNNGHSAITLFTYKNKKAVNATELKNSKSLDSTSNFINNVE